MMGRAWDFVRRKSRATLMVLASLTSLASAAETPRTKPDRSQFLFTNGVIPTLHLEVKGTNLTQLRRNDREYVRATCAKGPMSIPTSACT
jgi:hypothetical protein